MQAGDDALEQLLIRLPRRRTPGAAAGGSNREAAGADIDRVDGNLKELTGADPAAPIDRDRGFPLVDRVVGRHVYRRDHSSVDQKLPPPRLRPEREGAAPTDAAAALLGLRMAGRRPLGAKPRPCKACEPWVNRCEVVPIGAGVAFPRPCQVEVRHPDVAAIKRSGETGFVCYPRGLEIPSFCHPRPRRSDRNHLRSDWQVPHAQ